MKVLENIDESLFPVMKFHPVLTVPAEVTIPLEIMRVFSLESATDIPSAKGIRHFVCVKSGICHKKQSIHLFLAALVIFQRSTSASTIWLLQDSSHSEAVEVIPKAVTLTEEIQLYLAQSGFNVDVTNRPISLSDPKFVQQIALRPESLRVA